MWRAQKALGLRGKPLGVSALSGEGTDTVLARVKRLVLDRAAEIAGPPLTIDVTAPDGEPG